jgi:hypothetical protein
MRGISMRLLTLASVLSAADSLGAQKIGSPGLFSTFPFYTAMPLRYTIRPFKTET